MTTREMTLLKNLCGSTDINSQSYDQLTKTLTDHFKDSVHVQAARYEFYNCNMKPDQSYADWVATLRGLSKDCQFVCSNNDCRRSYVDELIRDLIIKETPHADVRRQCLMETNPSLEDVLKKPRLSLELLRLTKLSRGKEARRNKLSIK